MSSFQSFLHVSGKKYEILYSDLDVHQKIDSLGRPASPTFGGRFNVEMNMPGRDDPTLPDWMFDPVKTLSCKVVLKRIDTNATLKTIKFYNAYCVGMTMSFDGTANASSFRLRLSISPEQFDINGLFHDNKWPDESPIQEMADEDGPSEPGLLSDIAHGVLDVVGMVPVMGELADGANALFYLAEGNKTDAALSAAAMIPIAGWAATGAKVVRKGVKIANKARGLKKAERAWKSGLDFVEKGEKWAGKLQRGSTGFLGSPRLNRSQLNTFKQQAKKLGAELEIVKDKQLLQKFAANKAQAGFEAITGKLYVRKGATYYEVTHEMKHADQWASLGQDLYNKQSRLQKETHVYEELMKQKDKLTHTEIEHATDYINKIRRLSGLPPVD